MRPLPSLRLSLIAPPLAREMRFNKGAWIIPRSRHFRITEALQRGLPLSLWRVISPYMLLVLKATDRAFTWKVLGFNIVT